MESNKKFFQQEEDRNIVKWLLVSVGWAVGSIVMYFLCRNLIPGWALALTLFGYLVCMYVSGFLTDEFLPIVCKKDPGGFTFFLEGLLAPLFIAGMILCVIEFFICLLLILILGGDPVPKDW